MTAKRVGILLLILLLVAVVVVSFFYWPGWKASLPFMKTPPPAMTSVVPLTTATPTESPAKPSPDAAVHIQLVWWTPEWLSPLAANNGGQMLADSIARFEKAYPNITVKPVLKSAYGSTGILNYLQASQKVAPGALPDMVSLDFRGVGEAVKGGLLQPLLPKMLPPENGYYPFARSAWKIGGAHYVLPYTADVEHIAYLAGKVSSPPRDWSDLLNEKWRYLLPAGGYQGEANAAFLIQYIGGGGNWDDSKMVVAQPLQRALDFYSHALGKGTFPPAVLSFATPDDAWQPFLLGGGDIVEIRATRFLRQRTTMPDLRFAPVPTANGTVLTIASGWGLSMVATVPKRQEASMAFMHWLASDAEMSRWSFAAQRLPTRPAALESWPQRDDYVAFLSQLLQLATLEPVTPTQRALARSFQQALNNVLAGKETPASATDAVLKQWQQ